MDFSYTDQQKDLKQLVEKILRDHCEHSTLEALERSESTFHKKLWKELASSGLLGTPFSRSVDGSNLGFLETCIIAEVIGYYSVNIPFIYSVISTGMAINKFGSKNQKKELIPKIVSGESLLSIALKEPSNDEPRNPRCLVSEKKGVNKMEKIDYDVVLEEIFEDLLEEGYEDTEETAELARIIFTERV